ncbi:NUDIX hydrolase [Micromonospora saelicesensis]|uniref:NUDIX hydrolase n=1 Tax=Micromonospora saelicesensis TaxID=285676 RepID=UPI000DD7160A|nr:NUDIX domain-containing protein [Micromonospora saelicesensis]
MTEVASHIAEQPWKVYGERIVYNDPWVQLALVDVQPPGADRFEYRSVRLPRVAVAVVLDDQDRVLMLWRYRVLASRWGWELPGGIVDEGEQGTEAAAREVEEETGWRPGPLTHLITYQPTIGMVDAPHEVYLARHATKVGQPSDPMEAGKVEWINLGSILALLERDQLLSSGTLVGLLQVLAFRSKSPGGGNVNDAHPVDLR